jgi:hypothetical protein
MTVGLPPRGARSALLLLTRGRAVVLGVVFGLWLSALSCGPTGTCRPGACEGCCDAAGVCRAGTNTVECGRAGNFCRICGQSQQCTEQRCLTPESVDAGEDDGGFEPSLVGLPCVDDGDCGGGTCLPESSGFPSGFCTQRCEPAACPTGTRCSALSDASRPVCGLTCAIDGGASNCRAGYVCDWGLAFGAPQALLCVPACQTQASCAVVNGRRLSCDEGFCCGARGFRCCSQGQCPVSGVCEVDAGRCG